MDSRMETQEVQPHGDVLTIEQVAETLHVGKSTVWKLIKDEGLPSMKAGRRRLVPRKELLEWISDRAREEG